MNPDTLNLIHSLEALLEELRIYQETKVLRKAREHLPHLTADDILNAHDFPELAQDPLFHYEEGIAAGILMAQAALRRQLADLRSPTAGAQNPNL